MKRAAYTLAWTETFARTARKFLKRHPELVAVFRDALETLEREPQAPKLRLHALSGKHAGKHAVRVSYACRLVLVLRLTEEEIVLLDVGSHDEVYG
jgi:mRNA-degrading endonuclease YafQ of YafQ-DinJ toxin-antitoxin module